MRSKMLHIANMFMKWAEMENLWVLQVPASRFFSALTKEPLLFPWTKASDWLVLLLNTLEINCSSVSLPCFHMISFDEFHYLYQSCTYLEKDGSDNKLPPTPPSENIQEYFTGGFLKRFSLYFRQKGPCRVLIEIIAIRTWCR